MNDQYLLIQKEHLEAAWSRGEEMLEQALPATRKGDCLCFQAFGEECEFCPEKISLAGKLITGAEGILISLYARNVLDEPPELHPLQSFKELPDSGPYQAAFVARSEQILIPHVPTMMRSVVISLSPCIRCLVFPSITSSISPTRNSPQP
jgi:hypothetical protein